MTTSTSVVATGAATTAEQLERQLRGSALDAAAKLQLAQSALSADQRVQVTNAADIIFKFTVGALVHSASGGSGGNKGKQQQQQQQQSQLYLNEGYWALLAETASSKRTSSDAIGMLLTRPLLPAVSAAISHESATMSLIEAISSAVSALLARKEAVDAFKVQSEPLFTLVGALVRTVASRFLNDNGNAANSLCSLTVAVMQLAREVAIDHANHRKVFGWFIGSPLASIAALFSALHQYQLQHQHQSDSSAFKISSSIESVLTEARALACASMIGQDALSEYSSLDLSHIEQQQQHQQQNQQQTQQTQKSSKQQSASKSPLPLQLFNQIRALIAEDPFNAALIPHLADWFETEYSRFARDSLTATSRRVRYVFLRVMVNLISGADCDIHPALVLSLSSEVVALIADRAVISTARDELYQNQSTFVESMVRTAFDTLQQQNLQPAIRDASFNLLTALLRAEYAAFPNEILQSTINMALFVSSDQNSEAISAELQFLLQCLDIYSKLRRLDELLERVLTALKTACDKPTAGANCTVLHPQFQSTLVRIVASSLPFAQLALIVPQFVSSFGVINERLSALASVSVSAEPRSKSSKKQRRSLDPSKTDTSVLQPSTEDNHLDGASVAYEAAVTTLGNILGATSVLPQQVTRFDDLLVSVHSALNPSSPSSDIHSTAAAATKDDDITGSKSSKRRRSTKPASEAPAAADCISFIPLRMDRLIARLSASLRSDILNIGRVRELAEQRYSDVTLAKNPRTVLALCELIMESVSAALSSPTLPLWTDVSGLVGLCLRMIPAFDDAEMSNSVHGAVLWRDVICRYLEIFVIPGLCPSERIESIFDNLIVSAISDNSNSDMNENISSAKFMINAQSRLVLKSSWFYELPYHAFAMFIDRVIASVQSYISQIASVDSAAFASLPSLLTALSNMNIRLTSEQQLVITRYIVLLSQIPIDAVPRSKRTRLVMCAIALEGLAGGEHKLAARQLLALWSSHVATAVTASTNGEDGSGAITFIQSFVTSAIDSCRALSTERFQQLSHSTAKLLSNILLGTSESLCQTAIDALFASYEASSKAPTNWYSLAAMIVDILPENAISTTALERLSGIVLSSGFLQLASPQCDLVLALCRCQGSLRFIDALREAAVAGSESDIANKPVHLGVLLEAMAILRKSANSGSELSNDEAQKLCNVDLAIAVSYVCALIQVCGDNAIPSTALTAINQFWLSNLQYPPAVLLTAILASLSSASSADLVRAHILIIQQLLQADITNSSGGSGSVQRFVPLRATDRLCATLLDSCQLVASTSAVVEMLDILGRLSTAQRSTHELSPTSVSLMLQIIQSLLSSSTLTQCINNNSPSSSGDNSSTSSFSNDRIDAIFSALYSVLLNLIKHHASALSGTASNIPAFITLIRQLCHCFVSPPVASRMEHHVRINMWNKMQSDNQQHSQRVGIQMTVPLLSLFAPLSESAAQNFGRLLVAMTSASATASAKSSPSSNKTTTTAAPADKLLAQRFAAKSTTATLLARSWSRYFIHIIAEFIHLQSNASTASSSSTSMVGPMAVILGQYLTTNIRSGPKDRRKDNTASAQKLMAMSITELPIRRALAPGIFALLDIVGDRERDALMAVLDSASQAMFKALHSDYLAIFKYTGQ